VLPHARSYIHHLEKRARALGVRIRTNARVGRLVRDGGRITGVALEGGETILAARGVILASGDYSADRAMKAQFLPEELADVEGINPASTGDGQRMVQEVGGEIVNGAIMLGPEIRFIAPPAKKLMERIPPIRPVALAIRWAMAHLPSWLLRPFLMMFITTNLAPSLNLFRRGAILVNREGRRFVDERAAPQLAIARQTDRVAYVLMDAKIAAEFAAWPNFVSTAPGVAYAYVADYRRNRRDIFAEGASIAELAGKIGVPVAALEQTIADYNANSPPGMPRLDQAPWCALGPAKSWIVFTDGGARINARFEVLDQAGQPIPGLYAAGSAGQGGVLLEGHGHHLGWAFVSGRLAGRHAALGDKAWPDGALAARRAGS